jgi:hypothetical protein
MEPITGQIHVPRFFRHVQKAKNIFGLLYELWRDPASVSPLVEALQATVPEPQDQPVL